MRAVSHCGQVVSVLDAPRIASVLVLNRGYLEGRLRPLLRNHRDTHCNPASRWSEIAHEIIGIWAQGIDVRKTSGALGDKQGTGCELVHDKVIMEPSRSNQAIGMIVLRNQIELEQAASRLQEPSDVLEVCSGI